MRHVLHVAFVSILHVTLDRAERIVYSGRVRSGKDGDVSKTGVTETNDVTTDYNVDVDNVSSGASLTFPVQASALRKNGYAMLKGNPCKIVDMSTSKPGKHGHAKILLVGLDLFTGKRYEEMSPSSHTMSVPVVTRNDYLVIDMGHDGYLSLLTDDCHTKCDVRVQDAEMRKSLREKLDKRENNDVMVTIIGAMDKEMLMTIKVTK